MLPPDFLVIEKKIRSEKKGDRELVKARIKTFSTFPKQKQVKYIPNALLKSSSKNAVEKKVPPSSHTKSLTGLLGTQMTIDLVCQI